MRRRDSRAVDDAVVVRAERSAPRVARHWVMRTVAQAGVGGASNQVVELLTGELVSNAAIHGPAAGEIGVRVLVHEDGEVRVEVTDQGGGAPRVGHPEPTAASGRGLALVEALSSSWGTHPVPGGKVVWFEVREQD